MRNIWAMTSMSIKLCICDGNTVQKHFQLKKDLWGITDHEKPQTEARRGSKQNGGKGDWWTETYLVRLTPSWCGQSWGSRQRKGEGPGWLGMWGDWGRRGLEWDERRQTEWTEEKIKSKTRSEPIKGRSTLR